MTDTTSQHALLRGLPFDLRALRVGAARLSAMRNRKHAVWATGFAGVLVVAGLIGGLSAREARSKELVRDRHADLVAAAANGFSDAQLAALMANAGPGASRIAARVGEDGLVDERSQGLNLLEMTSPPALELRPADADAAARLNAAIPVSTTYNPAAKPFQIHNASEEAQALDCLTAAVYYEAANEPRASQEGVAQVVLNRVRHPAYPKSVCGVVFQGSERSTGCQFSFTCDGSMARTPARWAWQESRDVAQKALNGYVMAGVGSATHYHANYVMPYWSPTLIKVAQFGLHIFYRPTGPSLLYARYGGGEARYSKVSLIGKAQAARAADVTVPLTTGLKTPAPTAFLEAALTPEGRMHAVIAAAGGAYATRAPMHEMIMMRAAMARQAREELAADRKGSPAMPASPGAAPVAAAPVPSADTGAGAPAAG